MNIFHALLLVANLMLVGAPSSLAQGEDTLVIGDSIFSLNGEIVNELRRNTTLDIRSVAKNGATIEDVIVQYENSTDPDTVTRIIMNGGGNNVLDNLRACRRFSEFCQTIIDDSVTLGLSLVTDMEDDGVKEIVYLGYYYTTGFIAGGLEDALDYAIDGLNSVCDVVSIRCTFVDTRETFSGQGLRTIDGIHPSKRGSRLLASFIVDALEADLDTNQESE